jgi:hypothetical protein
MIQREIIKIRAEIKEIETKNVQRFNYENSCFFKQLDNIDKPLANLTLRRKDPK